MKHFAICVLDNKGKVISKRLLHTSWDRMTEQDCESIGMDYKEQLSKIVRDELRDEIELRTIYDLINESEGKKK